MTEEMAYAPITYNDGSSIDFQDKSLLNLTLAGELAVVSYEYCTRVCMFCASVTVSGTLLVRNSQSSIVAALVIRCMDVWFTQIVHSITTLLKRTRYQSASSNSNEEA